MCKLINNNKEYLSMRILYNHNIDKIIHMWKNYLNNVYNKLKFFNGCYYKIVSVKSFNEFCALAG